MSGMRDCHRLFLQTFMSHGILSGKEVKKYYKESCTRYNEAGEEKGLADFVQLINGNIKPMFLEIKKVVSEDTGVHCYGLVNLRESDITKMSTMYSTNELEYFKKLVEAVVESETGTVSSIDALNLADKLERRIGKRETQDLLDRMEQEKWVIQTPQGLVCLSARSILELEQYIIEQYPDFATMCNICKRLCLQGQSCGSCDVRLHLYCSERYFQRSTEHRCPAANCGATWPHTVPTLSRQRGDVTASQGLSQASQSQPVASQSTSQSTSSRPTRSSRR